MNWAAARPSPSAALSQDGSIEARIAIDETMSRPFRHCRHHRRGGKIDRRLGLFVPARPSGMARPDLRVLIRDPHNEFPSAFPEQPSRPPTPHGTPRRWNWTLLALSGSRNSSNTLQGPRSGMPEEVDLLRDFIPVAKQMLWGRSAANPVIKADQRPPQHSDRRYHAGPLPHRRRHYRLLDERIGLLDAKGERPALRVRLGGPGDRRRAVGPALAASCSPRGLIPRTTSHQTIAARSSSGCSTP